MNQFYGTMHSVRLWLVIITVLYSMTAAGETIVGLDLTDQSAKSAMLVLYESDGVKKGKYRITEEELLGLEVLKKSGKRLVLVYLEKLEDYAWLDINKLKLSNTEKPICQKSLPSRTESREVHGISGIGGLYCKEKN